MTLMAPDTRTVAPASSTGSGADRWLELVETAIEMYRARAFHDVTLESVAEAAGTHLNEVTAWFPGMSDLVVATIQTWNARRMEPILPIAERYGAVAFLRAVVIANIADPALMRLLSAVVNIAATPDHAMAPILQSQWVQFHAAVQRTLAHDIAVGREPTTMEPARGAEQLIALYEGLQLQSMVRVHMNVLESYDRAVTRLRDGWSRAYQPPAWEI